jgi:endonuclease-3
MTYLAKALEEMEYTLKNNTFSRSTALDLLQKQEEGNPFKVLIGTILSSRTRDEHTTHALTKLFAKYKGSQEIADADIEDIKKSHITSRLLQCKGKKNKRSFKNHK